MIVLHLLFACALSGCLQLFLAASSSASPAGIFRNHEDYYEVVRGPNGELRGVRDRREKDFVLGGLFALHKSSDCLGGSVTDLRRLEAMFYAIDRINANSTLLGGLELGFDVRDTCATETVGLDEALDQILSGSQLIRDIESCIVEEENATVPTIGIVGPAKSRVSVPVASLTRLFTTPQVSYASSSDDLSDRDRYPYFFRTIPSDNSQARAMVDFLLKFNLTHISVFYSRDTYGQGGRDELERLAEAKGICIGADEGVVENANSERYLQVAQKILNSTARVVVAFALRENLAEVLEQVSRITMATGEGNDLVWLISDAGALIAQSNPSLQTPVLAGHFGFIPSEDPVEDFSLYYSNLTIANNVRNPWFPEYFASSEGCVLNCTTEDSCCDDGIPLKNPEDDGVSKAPLVIDAVYAFAQAINSFLTENCDQPVQWYRRNQTCKGQRLELNGPNLLEYLRNVSFLSPTGNKIDFDESGNVEGKYDILNLQVTANGSAGMTNYMYEMIGIWDGTIDTNNSRLELNVTKILQFGIEQSGSINYEPPPSRCGVCEPGEYLRVVPSSCCGICEKCLGEYYSDNPAASGCQDCSKFGEMWGNNPTKGSDSCVEIDETHIDYTDPGAIVVVILAIIGLITVSFTAIVFGIFWTSSIVKSSGREQMIILLAGIALSFIFAVIYVAPPSVAICSLKRIGLYICFSVMFGALLVKIVRVARIFLRKSSLVRPRFIEPGYQVLFTLIIVAIQVIIVVISLAIKHPDTDRDLRRDSDNSNAFPKIEVTCVPDPLPIIVLSVIYQSTLILFSTVLGVLSFRYPENFNEARYISFCTFALLVIWIAYIPSYFATESQPEIQDAAVALAVVMSAFAVLVCLFGPKLYIILFHPERNSPDYSSKMGKKYGTGQISENAGAEMAAVLSKTPPPPTTGGNSTDPNSVHHVKPSE